MTRHLSTAGYKVIQLDTSDKLANRGIDVGILTRLELAGSPEAHQITFENRGEACGRTRDIVGVPLKLPDGETLYLFAVHFPSGNNQFECRIRAFKKLNELVTALPAGSLAVRRRLQLQLQRVADRRDHESAQKRELVRFPR